MNILILPLSMLAWSWWSCFRPTVTAACRSDRGNDCCYGAHDGKAHEKYSCSGDLLARSGVVVSEDLEAVLHDGEQPGPEWFGNRGSSCATPTDRIFDDDQCEANNERKRCGVEALRGSGLSSQQNAAIREAVVFQYEIES